jgi:hypothetical protein
MKRCEVCTSVTNVAKTQEVERFIEVTRCVECAYADRLPWDVLVGLVLSLGLSCSQRIAGTIHATCDFFGRTEKQLWDEVERTDLDYTHIFEEEEPEERYEHGH